VVANADESVYGYRSQVTVNGGIHNINMLCVTAITFEMEATSTDLLCAFQKHELEFHQRRLQLYARISKLKVPIS
jgi:hypothetical protein